MKRKERYELVIEHFRNTMPEVTTELQFGSVFQLLVATMLSAQCTDKRINMVTPELFKHYPDAKTMSEAEEAELFEYIKSVSYPNAKAHHLAETSKILSDKYNGEVPVNFNDLVSLPGVGRKTANVIEAVAFGKAAMAVDTHVFRVSHRLGLVPANANTPLLVERFLTKNIDDKDIPKAHHWLLLHGRYICQSRKPKCELCPFDSFCPKNNT